MFHCPSGIGSSITPSFTGIISPHPQIYLSLFHLQKYIGYILSVIFSFLGSREDFFFFFKSIQLILSDIYFFKVVLGISACSWMNCYSALSIAVCFSHLLEGCWWLSLLSQPWALSGINLRHSFHSCPFLSIVSNPTSPGSLILPLLPDF